MALTNLGRRFHLKAEEAIRKIAQDLSEGPAQELPEIHYQKGIIKGIRISIGMMEDSERD